MDPDFRFLGSQTVSLVWLFKGELQMSKELRYYFLNTFLGELGHPIAGFTKNGQ